MNLFDSHCHLNDPDFARDLDEVLSRARSAGVAQMLVVGYDAETSRRAVELAQCHRGLYAAVGMHPHHARDLDDRTAAELAVLASKREVVAVGETGLDFFRNLSPRQDQIRAFRRQIQMAGELDKPLVIHSRDAYEEILAILAEEGVPRRGAVLHCFLGNMAMAERAIGMGLMLGIAGPVTYKKNEELRRIVCRVPLESLLIETDCPYLSPEPLRGRRNEPANVAYVARKLAELRGISPEAAAEVTTRNAKALFLQR